MSIARALDGWEMILKKLIVLLNSSFKMNSSTYWCSVGSR